MKNFFSGLRPCCSLPLWRGLTALVLSGIALTAQAQFVYSAKSTTYTTTSYTDLGGTGTAIATANTDDANSAPQPIGFSFTYNGTAFTQFVLNTNGLLRLGANAPSTVAARPRFALSPQTGPINSTNPADVNLLMPFNADLVSGTSGAEYRVATTGTAGSRICTIQWKNVADKAVATDTATAAILPTQYDDFSFQVKLYEGSNQIDFVYDKYKMGTEAIKSVVIGLKGSSNAAGQDLLGSKPSPSTWNATTFYTGSLDDVYSAVRYLASVGPDAGSTYRFVALKANDATVTAIYTFGKLSTSVNLPHTVKAHVVNQGYTRKTDIVVTLNVTGANTFTDTKTIPALASEDTTTVTFNNYPALLNAGTNTVTVTVPADDDNTNNTATYGQVVSPTHVSYVNPNGTFFTALGIGIPEGGLATRYTLATPAVVTDVTLSLDVPDGTAATDTCIYKVVLYDTTGPDGTPGKALYTSPDQLRIGTGNPVITIPAVKVPSTFYIALVETKGYVGVNLQAQNPIQPKTTYVSLGTLGGGAWGLLSDFGIDYQLGIEFSVQPANCLPPSAITATNVTGTTASIGFTAPGSGTSGYQVVYGLAGFDPATEGTTVAATTSPVVISGLNPTTIYQVYMRSSCTSGGTSALANPIVFTTTCPATPAITAFPYTQNFDVAVTSALPCGITVLDANGDKATWSLMKDAVNSAPNAMRYTSAISNSVAADDWFFTPALSTTVSTRYQVAFRYRAAGIVGSPSNYTEKLEVKAGPTATPAGQTTLLYTNADITNTSYELAGATSTPAVAVFTPGAGTQYIGFHVYSAAGQGNLYIDDLSVTAAVVTATTSEVLLRAVSVFPNPSTTGVFDLEIHGAQARGSLDVLVTNTLGQQVYAGTARDNYTNRLDLSRLAPGLYQLRIRNGDQALTRQLAITK